MDLASILRFLHSWVRWLVVLVAVIDLVYFALGWLRNQNYDRRAAMLMRAFAGVISLQWLIGVIFLIVLGSQEGFSTMPWAHVGVMTLAVFVANIPNILRRRKLSDKQRYLVNLIIIIVVFVLIGIGISLLPADVIRWGF